MEEVKGIGDFEGDQQEATQSAPSIQELVEKLRQRLEAGTVKSINANSTLCIALYKYPALLDVVRVECLHPHSSWHDTGERGGLQAFCLDCGVEWEPTAKNLRIPTGYITRNWAGMPPGALRGAIEDAVEGTDLEDSYYLQRYENLIKRGVPHLADGPAVEALLLVLRKKRP